MKREYIKDFIVENVLFFVIVIITGIFIVSPLLLKIKVVSDVVSTLLKALETEGYRSTYIEMMGALLGTFLAISGALWTQRRISEKEEKNKVREKTLIIYYDFLFAVNNICDFYDKVSVGMAPDDFWNNIKAAISSLEIQLYDEWMLNIVSISKYLKNEEVKEICKIYSELNKIKKMIPISVNDLTEAEVEKLCEAMSKCVESERKESLKKKYIANQEIVTVLNRLKIIGKF